MQTASKSNDAASKVRWLKRVPLLTLTALGYPWCLHPDDSSVREPPTNRSTIHPRRSGGGYLCDCLSGSCSGGEGELTARRWVSSARMCAAPGQLGPARAAGQPRWHRRVDGRPPALQSDSGECGGREMPEMAAHVLRGGRVVQQLVRQRRAAGVGGGGVPAPAAAALPAVRADRRLKSTQATELTAEAAKLGPQRDELDLTFTDTRAAFQSKTTWEVLRGVLVYTLCTSRYLVDNNAMVRPARRSDRGGSVHIAQCQFAIQRYEIQHYESMLSRNVFIRYWSPFIFHSLLVRWLHPIPIAMWQKIIAVWVALNTGTRDRQRNWKGKTDFQFFYSFSLLFS